MTTSAHCDERSLDVVSAKVPRIKGFKTMYDGSELDDVPHRWLKANHTQNRMRRHEHNVGNVSWYERQRSSLGRRQTEIRCAKKDAQDGHGSGW